MSRSRTSAGLAWHLVLAAGLASAAAALPGGRAGAQERDVIRQSYRFFGSSLGIDVLARAPGVLHVTRGTSGRVEIAARTPTGFAGAGLQRRGHDRLMLTALGADRVEYIVFVPADVRVEIRLPDRHVAEVFGSLDDVATYEWTPVAEGQRSLFGGSTAAPPADAGAEPASPAAPRAAPTRTAPTRRYLVYDSGRAPATVSLPDARALTAVTVRWQGARFEVVASRPLELSAGDPAALDIRTAGEPIELDITVPAGTRDFLLEIGGATALLIARGAAVALCSPRIEQELDAGRRWFTFTPADGRLDCRPATPSRRA